MEAAGQGHATYWLTDLTCERERERERERYREREREREARDPSGYFWTERHWY